MQRSPTQQPRKVVNVEIKIFHLKQIFDFVYTVKKATNYSCQFVLDMDMKGCRYLPKIY